VPRWSSRRCRRFVGIFLGEGHERVSKRRPAFGQSQRYDGGPTSTIRLAIGALDLQFVKSSVKERFRGPAQFHYVCGTAWPSTGVTVTSRIV